MSATPRKGRASPELVHRQNKVDRLNRDSNGVYKPFVVSLARWKRSRIAFRARSSGDAA